MSLAPVLALATAAALLSFLLTPIARVIALRIGAVDLPDARKVHSQPTPRLGGLAVVASATGMLVGLALMSDASRLTPRAPLLGAIAIGLVPVFLVSLWDDIRPLRALPKFLGQLTGAGLAVWLGIALDPSIHFFGSEFQIGRLGSAAISVFWLVGVTNAFNIVDGLDGLASGLALISSGTLAAVSLLGGSLETAAVALVLAGAIAGFLPFNIHPAKIFLGDCGSASIGFCIACLALKGGSTLTSGFAALIPVFALGLPIAETLVSIARRVVRRAEGATAGVFEADRNHFHHRLLALGLDQRRAVLTLYGVGIVASAAGMLSILMTARQAGMVLGAALVAAFVGIGKLGYDEFAFVRSGKLLRAYDAPVLKKALFVVFIDLVLIAVGVWGALVLKNDSLYLGRMRGDAFEMFVLLAPITVLSFWWSGVYRGAWRVASVDDFSRLSLAIGGSHLVGWMGNALFGGTVSVVLFFLSALVVHFLLVGARVSYRVLASLRSKAQVSGTRTIIYGAGNGGILALRELHANQELGLRPIGFLDDDPAKKGIAVNGFRVFGDPGLLGELAAEGELVVVVSSKSISAERRKALCRECSRLDVRVVQLQVSFDDMHVPVLGPDAEPVTRPTIPGHTASEQLKNA